MAFVTPLPQEQQNQYGPQGQTTPNPLAMLPPQAGGSSGQGGASGANPPSVGTPTQFGSTASRLSDYLKANQDQVQQMANQISGQMGTQFGDIQSGINKAGQDFANTVQQSYTPTDPTLLSQVQNDPVGAASDPNKVSSFQKQMNSQYTGPNSFESFAPYSDAQKGVQDAMQQASLLGTYPGLSQYLQGHVEKNATPGQTTLDTVLLQGNQPAYQTVQDAAKPFSGLGDYLTNVGKPLNESVLSAKQAATQAKDASRSVFSKATGDFSNQLNSQFDTAKNSAQNFNTNFNDIIARLGYVNPPGMTNGIQPLSIDEQNALGIDQAALNKYGEANQALNLYGNAPGPIQSLISQFGASAGIPLSTYLSGGNTTLLPSGVAETATPGDYEKAQAFKTLGGDQYESPISGPGTYRSTGNYQTFDRNRADDLFNQVSSRDKVLADNYLSTSGINLGPGNYAGALQQQLGNENAFVPGSDSQYILSALNRIVNGFEAPEPGYTPQPTPPDPLHPIPGPDPGTWFGFV